MVKDAINHHKDEINRYLLPWIHRVSCLNRTVLTEVLTNKQPRRPDICVITNQQAQSIESTSAILKTAPPLLVEVVSPESVDRDYNQKTSEYAAIGVVEYWIVDPLKNKVTVCLLDNGSYKQTVFTGNQLIISQTFAGLTLTAQQVFSA
ncbi:MAG: Uma2 family endonuclease [Nostoc sp.]